MSKVNDLIAQIPEAVAQSLVDQVEHVSTDGTSVTVMDPEKSMDVLDRLREEKFGKPNNLGLKMVALNAPAGGGR